MSAARIRMVGWALILLSSLLAGLYLPICGAAALGWDDSEYISQALATHDQVKDAGVWTWPQYVARHQQYLKPPLLVNLLAGATLILGRSHIWGAAGVVLALSSLALLAAVWHMVSRSFGGAGALAALLAVSGLPVVVAYSPQVVVEVQLAAIVLWMLALLVDSPQGWPGARWALMLGLLLGLGMLAKVTFPFYAAAPLALWLWEGRTAGFGRWRALALAGLVAAVVAGVWYITNWRDALSYARSAAVFVLDPGSTATGRIVEWLTILFRDGVGWALAAAALVALGAWDRSALRLSGWLVASALPLAVTAILSPAPPTMRHLLVSEVELGLVASVMIAAALHSGALPAWRRLAVFVLLGVGCGAGMIVHSLLPFTQLWEGTRVQHVALSLMRPVETMNTCSEAAVEDAFHMLEAAGEPEAALLVGNDRYMNVPRLALKSVTSGRFTRFDYATYFSWSESRSRDSLAAAREAGRAILYYSRPWSGESAYLNRYEDLSWRFLTDPANGYHEVARRPVLGATLSLYTHQPAAARAVPRLTEMRESFGGRIELLAGDVADGELAVRVRVVQRCPVSYKLMAHIHRDGEPAAHWIWDRDIVPPLTMWAVGQTRMLRYKLPDGFDAARDTIRIGFFDESDSAHGWPPLARESGPPYVVLRAR